MSNANLSASITMTNGASAVLKQVEGDIARMNRTGAASAVTADKMGYSWGKMAAGLAGATIGITAMARYLGEAAKAAAEDDKSTQSLNRTLINTGQAFQTQKLQEWVDTLSLSTGVTDTLIRDGLNKLVAATGNVEQSQSLLNLAMDISAGGFADLTSASKALASASLGNTTALSRLKLPIDAATLASKDMTKITAELAKVVGGQAAAAAESLQGRLDRLSVAASEAQEAIGYGLWEALDKIAGDEAGGGGATSAIVGLGEAIGDIISQAADGVVALRDLGATLADLVPTGADAATEQAVFDAALGAVAETTKALVAGPLYALGGAYDSIVPKTALADSITRIYSETRLAEADASRAAAAEIEEATSQTELAALAAASATPVVVAFADAMGLLDTKANQQQALRAWREGLREFVEKPSADAALDLVSNFQAAYESFKDGGRKQAKFVIENYDEMKESIQDSGLSEAAQRELIGPLTDAKNEARQVVWQLDQINGKNVSATISLSVLQSQLGAAWGRANGGYIEGPGTSTSDSIPARLSNGEYVVRAAAVDKVGRGFLDALNSGRLFGFRNGGGVQTTFNNARPGTNVNQAGYNYMTQMSTRPASANPPVPLGDKGNVDSNYFRQLAEVAGDAAGAADAAARAAEELARLEAQRLAEIRRQQQEVIGQARRLLEQAADTRDDYAKGVAKSGISFGSISGYDSAGSDWAALSMRAPGSAGAGGPATSPGSISAYMSSRLDRVRSFGDVLKKLNGAGLNQSTLREIIAAGPDEGTTLGQALLEAGVSEIGRVNSIQASLEDVSGDIGAYTANTLMGGAVVDAQGNYARVIGANGGVDDTPLQVILQLDGQVVVTQLLAIKRAKGGASLGLA